jgi:hypothetical protein
MHCSHRETAGRRERLSVNIYRAIGHAGSTDPTSEVHSYHCVLVNLAAKKFNHLGKFLIPTNLKMHKLVRKDYQQPQRRCKQSV